MTIEGIEKTINKNIGFYLLFFMLFIGFIIIGSTFFSEEQPILGILLFVLAIFVLSWSSIRLVKKNRILYKMLIEKQKERYLYFSSTLDQEDRLATLNERNITFDEYTFHFEGERIRYEDCHIAFSIFSKVVYSPANIIPCIIIIKDSMLEYIPISASLINIIEKYDIKLVNSEDYQFLLKEPDKAFKQIQKAKIMPNQLDTNYVFIKNSNDKLLARKVNIKAFVLGIIAIVLAIGINLFFFWLDTSEKGSRISDSFAFSIGFKILYTIILFSLIFVKSKKLHTNCKWLIFFYIVAYWINIMFLSFRVGFMVDFIFTVLLLSFAFIYRDKQLEKPTNMRHPFNRCFSLACFLFLMTFPLLDETNLVSEKAWFLTAAMITSAFSVCLIIGIIVYYQKKKPHFEGKALKTHKTNCIVMCFTLPIVIFVYITFQLYSFNIVLDRSEPMIYHVEVIELYKDSDNYRMMKVNINGKDESFRISAQEYNRLLIGDMVDVPLFTGAFNWPYYVYLGQND